jgi:hypothetical protein
MQGGFGNNGSFGDLIMGALAFAGQLASQILLVLTSGPALGFLSALVLLLAVAALLKVLFSKSPTRREPQSERRTAE